MRKNLFKFVCLSIYFINLTISSSTHIHPDILRGIQMIGLPDGESLLGGGFRPSTFFYECQKSVSWEEVLNAEAKFQKILMSKKITSSEALEAIKAYQQLLGYLQQMNPDVLRFFESVLRCGNVYGTPIDGLTPQPQRAKIFQELYEWRTGMRSDANHAFKAINDERERLETIAAAEAAQRKKEADRRVAEQDTTQAPSTSIAYKPRGKSNGLRRRHLPQDANGANDGTEMDTHTPHSPLIVAH